MLRTRRTRVMPGIDLMAMAEGLDHNGKKSRALDDLRGKALDRSIFSAFESPELQPSGGEGLPSPKSDLPSPVGRLSASFTMFEQPTSPTSPPLKAPAPKAASPTRKPAESPAGDVVKASDPVDEGLARSPSLADNPFKQEKFMKGDTPAPRLSKADLPSPGRLSLNRFEQPAAATARDEPQSPGARASHNSLGDNPFLRSDSLKKNALTPPWHKTAVPIGNQGSEAPAGAVEAVQPRKAPAQEPAAKQPVVERSTAEEPVTEAASAATQRELELATKAKVETEEEVAMAVAAEAVAMALAGDKEEAAVEGATAAAVATKEVVIETSQVQVEVKSAPEGKQALPTNSCCVVM